MDKRSWPWKKKASDKQGTDKAIAALDPSTTASDTGSTQVDKVKQDNYRKPKYVQISVESYTRLTELEDQLKFREDEVGSLETEVKELNENLSDANIEMTNKENLVKQHAKVAEEAVSGWEKAEVEAASLKNHLESVTLLRLTAEDKASHLDGALKECMKQIRNLKEEHDKKLQDVVLNKAKQFDKMKLELEAKIANLDQELMASAAENAALSRSLQERSNLLIKINEEKSQAQAEIQLLKFNIESFEKETHSLKYELHIARKEVEIRCEEKNMSLRSAEVANKQHLEGVKKIAKLEAECQRLRSLVRKKLPGPGAVAQMKLEVENLGRDYGEYQLRRSPVKPHSHHLSHLPEFSFDNTLIYQKENELLTERLLAMEEEMKMLKEALAKRNSELQASRSLCAETTSKLQCLTTQLSSNVEQRTPLRSNAQIPTESCTKKGSNPPSFTSTSDDGNDDTTSCAGSWAPVLISDPSNVKNDKNAGSPQKSETANHLCLMDDFLEMEKLACLSIGSNIEKNETSCEITTIRDYNSQEEHVMQARVLSKDDATLENSKLQVDPLIFVKLQSQISMVLTSISNDKNLEKVLENIKLVMQDMLETLDHKGVNGVFEVPHRLGTIHDPHNCDNMAKITKARRTHLFGDSNSCIKTVETSDQQLEFALSQLYHFVKTLGDEANISPGANHANGLNQKVNWFSARYTEALSSEINLIDFVFDMSHVLSEASEMHFNVIGFKSTEVETGSSDCIDKVALPENKVIADSSVERYPSGIVNFSDSSLDPDVANDGNLVPLSESTTSSWKCSLEEFEQLKLDRDNLVVDLAKCMENLENTQSKLLETEGQLSEVKSQLAVALKSNGLAETQLKCMAESYKSLETRAEQLQTEVNLLQGKIEILDNELQEERKNHQDAVAKFNDLQEHLQRVDCFSTADYDKTSQQKELEAAAEKLAECQETMFLLGKQLKAFRPQTEILSLQENEAMQNDEEAAISGINLQHNLPSETDTSSSFNVHNTGSESPSNTFNSHFSPSRFEANNPPKSPTNSMYSKHSPSNSGSSSSSPTPTPEKQARGFSRFFSAKPKNGL